MTTATLDLAYHEISMLT